VPDEHLIDERLSGQMALTRRLVELGRSARASAAVRIRQPLARALVDAAGFAGLPAELRAQVAEELNVHGLEPLAAVGGELVDYTVKPNFRTLGKRFGNRTPVVAAAIESADAAVLAGQLSAGATASVQVDGAATDLGPDDVIVTQVPRSGWAVASDGGETLALEVVITPELRREGLAREVVRLVQDARKSDGLDVSDRIWLRWLATDSELAAALAEHGPLISAEVLAVDYGPLASGGQAEAGVQHVDADLGLTFWIRRAPDPAR
jgi:isoleucyl-tRNA synthetase